LAIINKNKNRKTLKRKLKKPLTFSRTYYIIISRKRENKNRKTRRKRK